MTTNILIVGNGFDLSHYLPTKYDHFMDVMESIEAKDTGGLPKDLDNREIDELIAVLNTTFEKRNDLEEPKYEMNFEDLFSKSRDHTFIEKTKKYYKTEEVILSSRKVIEIQYRLAKNCWYKYFKSHVKEVKTWIDFETKVGDVLEAVSCFFKKLEAQINDKGYFVKRVIYRGETNSDEIFLWLEYCNILENFKIFESGYYIDQHTQDESGSFMTPVDLGEPDIGGEFRYYIADKYTRKVSSYAGLDSGLILSNLQTQLDEFIEIFNLYLELIIDKLKPKYKFKISAENWEKPNHIFSFNYTNTFNKTYVEVTTEFLHGRFGDEKKIVLGVSDLQDESLKNLKAYGFTKYHQKLFKGTDYLFLYSFRQKLHQLEEQINILEFKQDRKIPQPAGALRYGQQIEELKKDRILNLVVSIWGHSLDVSDKDYIIDLFSLNDEIDRNVRVTVYYFDNSAKFSLLNNLLAILKKDKVEHWMKNEWLKFKENPKIGFGIDENSDIQEAS